MMYVRFTFTSRLHEVIAGMHRKFESCCFKKNAQIHHGVGRTKKTPSWTMRLNTTFHLHLHKKTRPKQKMFCMIWVLGHSRSSSLS